MERKRASRATISKTCFDLISEIGKRSVEIDRKYGRDIAADCMCLCVMAIEKYERENGGDSECQGSEMQAREQQKETFFCLGAGFGFVLGILSMLLILA